jgi:hypothetical protein
MSFNGCWQGLEGIIGHKKFYAITVEIVGNMAAPCARDFQAAGRRLLRPLQSKMPAQSGSSVSSKIREEHRIRMSFSACEPFASSLLQRAVPVKSCNSKGKYSYEHPENGLDAADVFK